MSRRPVAILIGLFAAGLWAAACSEQNRHQVLSFFFDGVPEPGAPPRKPRGPGLLPGPSLAERRVEPRYDHPPYRDDRCRDCHNPNGRWLVRTPEEGLCQRCHPAIPGTMPYVHGPVAANACLACHHYHTSPYPWVLLADPKELCLRCHVRTELTRGSHHAALDEQACLDCHDPHGGDDRNFLRKQRREAGE